MTYLTNIKAWATGWGRFDEIDFKPGWSRKSPAWWLLYAFNYGTRVLSGGACVSWSKWFHGQDDSVSKFITRVLDRLDANHGADAGPPLWGTKDTKYATEGAIAFWGLLILGLVLLG